MSASSDAGSTMAAGEAPGASNVSVSPGVASAESAMGTPMLDVAGLASEISSAVVGADGTVRVNVAMHPVTLGAVQAVVALNGGDLHVAITPQTSLGHQALREAMDGLTSELSQGGLNVNVSLRDPGSSPQPESPPSGPSGELESASGVASPASEPTSLTTSQIHLIL